MYTTQVNKGFLTFGGDLAMKTLFAITGKNFEICYDWFIAMSIWWLYGG